MSTPRYASGGFVPPGAFGKFIPPKLPNCRCTLTVTSADVYRITAQVPDPSAETWRWQRAGHLVTVLLRKIALRPRGGAQ